MSTNTVFQRAAQVIQRSDALLVCTGAGMGVDSGLGTFRGRNAGVWAPLKAMGVDFSEMSNPEWFQRDPRLAWAFWHFRHQAYTLSQPHEGYNIIARWGNKMKHGIFSATSNIDGHWIRTDGVGPEKTYECHGTLLRMQCVEDDGRIWPTDDAQISALKVPEWDLSAGEKVEVKIRREHSEWTDAVVGEDGCTIMNPSTKKTICVVAVRRPGGPDLMRVLEGCPLPKCMKTGKEARPNVLMFGDWGVNCEIIDQQYDKLSAWAEKLPRDANLAVVEIGAGTAVPTIRHMAQSMALKFPNSFLIRCNLDDKDIPKGLTDRALVVDEGALAALTQIDQLISAQ